MSLGRTAQRLRQAGIETVGVIGSPLDRARPYFRIRPPGYPVGADGDLVTHRAFGVPRTEITEAIVDVIKDKVDGLARDAGVAAPPGEGWPTLDRVDGIDPVEHGADIERHQVQFTAQFLIDRDGIVRWVNVECAREGLAGLDRFPTDAELLEAARTAGVAAG